MRETHAIIFATSLATIVAYKEMLESQPNLPEEARATMMELMPVRAHSLRRLCRSTNEY